MKNLLLLSILSVVCIISTSPVRWGILSTAHINNSLLKAFEGTSRSKVVAIASRNLNKAHAYAQERGIPKAYGSYEELLQDPDIDAVYISVPNKLHAQWILKTIEAQKHVLCEKPLVTTIKDFDTVQQTAQKNNVIVIEAFAYLHHPQSVFIKEIIEQGYIGEILFIRSYFTAPIIKYPDNIRWKSDLDGGCLWDLGVYPISFMLNITQANPSNLEGHFLKQQNVDSAFTGHMTCNNIICHIYSSFLSTLTRGCEIIGTKGTLFITDPWKPGFDGKPSEIILFNGTTNQVLLVQPKNPYLCEIEAMENCILNGAKPIIDLEFSKKILETTLRFYQLMQ